jgi:hypothetical protein
VQPRPRSEPDEHPVVAWIALTAILLSSVAIFGAYLELKGLDFLIVEAPSPRAQAALSASLWSVTGEETR